ncbi:calcium uptake protein 3, mitochondrial isoform X4 [Neodiprion pinetum]|uniref:Calcium uptake protein 3, mitochondrial isoform X4 n=1 Tax=Neodiprion lecontei TaxID=441921 RepID=A0A6J0CFY5_NEOLC|nr:calcium uptake protein 3, mitochondrial isoform X4 [Neodiprion lecontei]XP_046489840.1 calcium uptake protein 3, mitochondrial isoform X4 [Neodiprion pinetum]
MAALASLSFRSALFSRSFLRAGRDFSSRQGPRTSRSLRATLGLALGSVVAVYVADQHLKRNPVHALKLRKRDDDLHKAVRLTTRERRFIKFASVEYDGQLYMTPQDFLDSVVESLPRPRLKRRILSDNEIEAMKNATPSLRQGSPQMFRTLRDKGILSYTEYLFLLSILTKPQTGFRIAFNMFDIDGNERVDKTEFLVIRRLLGGSLKERDLDEATSRAMEKIFSHAWRGRHGGNLEINSLPEVQESSDIAISGRFDDDQGLQRRHAVDTTLTTHFFGKTGKDELKYDGFRRFMENLQREVLELEFHEFSKGHDTISEMDFAKILLRYTYLDTDEYDKYLDRLLDRSSHEVGISFEEFRVFYQFLNNLEDFTIAMRMYTLADHPISKDEFHRAVKICTGTSLTTHIVDTVFAIFDVDGDGQLSYKEFIAIMKDRLHRGSKSQTRSEGWEAFKFCLKQEMKAP